MPRRVIEFPLKPPPLPEKLPGEDTISRGIDQLFSLMERDPILGIINKLVEKIPIVPERQYRTPFGTMKTPEFYIPKITPARFDTRQREAFKAAVMQDMVSLVNLIPGVSDAAGPVLDAINDTADAKIQDTLNPEETRYFRSYNKVDPSSTVAMIRTMVRTQKEP
jgi:hypothetical protein